MPQKNHIHALARAVIIDQEHLLVCKTLDLPSNFYFIPGGHIEHGESAEETVLRELKEESGAACRIKRFLGCLEHSFEPGYSSICHNHEYNFIFEAESDSLKFPYAIPQCEENIALLWMPLTEVQEIDFRPAPLKTLLQAWMAQDLKPAFQSVMK